MERALGIIDILMFWILEIYSPLYIICIAIELIVALVLIIALFYFLCFKINRYFGGCDER